MSLRLCCWILSVLLGSLCLSTARAQDATSNTSSTVTVTLTPSTPLTPSTSSTPLTPSTPSTPLPTPSLPASDLSACSTPVPQSCPTLPSPPAPLATIILAALLVISLVGTAILLLIVCWVCCRRTRETEIKKYVFEEGVQPPELWVDRVEKTDESHVWEEPTTFSPSPKSTNTTMPFPDSQNGNGNIQSVCDNGNEILHSNRKETIRPVPVAPVKLKKMSRFRPKRIAPPPPKMNKRKKLRRNKYEDDAVVYAVPSPYPAPVGGDKDSGYDVPMARKSKWRIPHIYKAIDVAKVKPPSPYADLKIKQ